MRPPSFWNNPPRRPGWQTRALYPLSLLWARATARRLATGPRVKCGKPVIAVGNINLGGTGKTPTVIALVEILKDMNLTPHIVSRGYGGEVEGPHLVDGMKDTAKKVGDEPLLLSGFAPVWVAEDRAAGAKAAVQAGADCILLDDALQNPALSHDLTVTVVDAAIGFGNGRVCPAGPLREPVDTGLLRTDFILAIGADADIETLDADWPSLAQIKQVYGQLEPLETGTDWRCFRAYAFAGIGRPQKFYKSLKAEGAELIATRSFADHEPFSIAILKRMQAEAWAKGANLVTTEKDAARLPPDFRAEVITFPVRLKLSQDQALKDALAALFAQGA
ncbi:MAG: tetraacyldisaccharide 4'-kinase [Pseudomonadota bacterium]